MRWSLSEFLNLLDPRSQCWGVIELGPNDGFRVRAGEAVMVHALLEGTPTLVSTPGGRMTLRAGDTVLMGSGAAHAVRLSADAQLHPVEFLDNDAFADTPYQLSLRAPMAARLLSGRLKVRWPGGLDPHFLPTFIKIAAEDQLVDLHALENKARGTGAAALLTRAAALMLTAGLRDHPECQSIFRDANFRDPISRALQFMERHLHRQWTVAMLASKVGMARSTFAGRFLAKVGKPPMEALTELRMNRAAELLTQTDMKISVVAEAVGYHSQSAFSRRFESHFRTTPGRMRGGHRPIDAAPAA